MGCNKIYIDTICFLPFKICLNFLKEQHYNNLFLEYHTLGIFAKILIPELHLGFYSFHEFIRPWRLFLCIPRIGSSNCYFGVVGYIYVLFAYAIYYGNFIGFYILYVSR